ncbi:hypothetical protein NFI95_14760 [Acetobacteraceae bacterium KSS8]|uniref:DUF4234 domain-containing protein n=1 Tax=Endosaccharibacter trunci TaxID=2812733 RepID=A0ABT1W9Z1_9PROT|nr:hypothetical protein [Acetobacteraceae bacterium KSS8]
MQKFSRLVIARTPRNKASIVLGTLGAMSVLAIWLVVSTVMPELAAFRDGKAEIRASSYAIKSLSVLFVPFIFASFSVAAIRNNTKSQPVETIIALSGLVISSIFIVLSLQILLLWAHLNGYHLDHFEAAHRGGWYVFKRDGI